MTLTFCAGHEQLTMEFLQSISVVIRVSKILKKKNYGKQWPQNGETLLNITVSPCASHVWIDFGGPILCSESFSCTPNTSEFRPLTERHIFLWSAFF